ncbi:MAG: LysR family transcriptional regulator [Cohaesibacteraceae bacterium]|nr:LysR family transcriptional regulator [Cohaesibacteraceae bacterium]MBL4875434.1 LysR family transcriptional regulator [Cohaesibacteraceae bacterium]
MDIRFLESLVAVIDGGSISAAARAQGLTATAVSQRIRALEVEFQTELLIRTGHAAMPSRTCIDLLPRARDLIIQSACLKRDFGRNSLSGPFCIGAIETALSEFIPSIVKTVSREAPDCNLSITPGTSRQLFGLLERDQIDLAVLVEPPFVVPKSYFAITLVSQIWLLTQHIDAGTITRRSLLEQPIILYDRQSWGGQLAWKWLIDRINPENILCELDAMRTIIAMVENGLGISLLPASIGLLAHKDDLYFTSPGQSLPERQIVLIGKKTEMHQPLCTLVQKAFRQLDAQNASTCFMKANIKMDNFGQG